MSTSIDTIERIYNAAEILFAEKGFSETSLRLITAKANVNLAAVNYHFGSKQGLIKAVFSRYLTKFCNRLEKKINHYEQQLPSPPCAEELLAMFIELSISVKPNNPHSIVTFMQLLSNALMQKQVFLYEYLINNFGKTFYRYIVLLRKSTLHDLSDLEWFWRIHFTLGTVLLNMANINSLKLIVKKEFNISIKNSQVIQLMVPFLTAGLLAKTSLKESALANIKYYAHRMKEN